MTLFFHFFQVSFLTLPRNTTAMLPVSWEYITQVTVRPNHLNHVNSTSCTYSSTTPLLQKKPFFVLYGVQ